MRTDVSSAFRGLTASLVELYTQIGDLGYSIKKVKYDKKEDAYIATAKNPHGEECSKTGPTDKVAVANLLLALTRKHHIRTTAQIRLGMWSPHHFVNQQRAMAEAYAKAPVYDPKAAAAWKELADDSTRRADALRKQIHIEETNDPEPYPHSQAMLDDIHKRQHFTVSTANCDHPVWTPEQNVNFRIVHDVLGHGVSGGDFGWEGENKACAAHFPLLSAEAQKALFSECIGQTAYAAHYRHFGPQKVALFPEFYEPAQKAEGVSPTFQGVHPSQSVAPVALPSIKPPGKPQEQAIPRPSEELGLSPMASIDDFSYRVTAIGDNLADPNTGYDPSVPITQPNAYLDHGDPLDGQAIMDNAKLIDTEWSKFKTGEGTPDFDRMKQAVVNAFRSVLLSPQKTLHQNTVQYQDISGVPANTTDPAVYYDTLENKRQEHNVKNFGEGARMSHRPYAQLLPKFENIVYQMNPQAGYEAAQKKAKRVLFDWETEEQARVMRAEKGIPEEKRRTNNEIELQVNKDLTKRLNTYVKEYQPKLDIEAAVTTIPQAFPQLDPQIKTPTLDKYGAFSNTHLKSIAQISQHADNLLKAALEDVHEHDGTGHHFRSAVMQLGISGVGPKVASFAWLMLQPTTSQLATIDHHLTQVLGNNPKDVNNRDFFKEERQLQAGRDAAGYGHIPLGAFAWGMNDAKQTGEGSHQDLAGMRVVDPKPHDAIDWPAKEQGLQQGPWHPPDWWQNTQPYRDQVGEEWDQNEAATQPKNRIPYQLISSIAPDWSFASLGKTSDGAGTSPQRVPWFVHPDTGERLSGQPGESLMSHCTRQLGLSTPDVWAQVAEAGKA